MESTTDEIYVSPHTLRPISRLSSSWSYYAALLLVLLLFASIRIRLRNMPLERDEGEYAYIGQLMLQGVPPYKLAYNMKLPGTYALYAVVMAIFGQTIPGIRVGMLLINGLTIALVFLLGRKIFGPVAGIVAASTYALLSNRVGMVGLDGHATHFVALMAVAASCLLLREIETGRTPTLFYSGLLYGLAFLMKQQGIFLTLFGVLYWLWSQWRIKAPAHKVIRQGFVLGAGIALPFLLTCAIMLGTGVFREFWFWTFSYGAKYVSITSLADGWATLRRIAPWIVRPLVIWGIAAVGLSAVIWNARARRYGVFLVGYFLFSFFAVCPGLYFRGHYFLVMLPAAALLAGVGIAAVRQYLQEHPLRFLPAWLTVFFFALTFLTAVYGHRKFLFEMDPIEVDEKMHPGDRFAEAVTVADYIQRHSSPQDQVAILGSEPEIYFYSHRHSATGYIYMYGMMENQPFAMKMQADMIAQVENAHPLFMVYVGSEHSWGWAMRDAKTRDLFAWMQRYLGANYKLAQKIIMHDDPPHLEGDQAYFYVFQRKSQ